MGRGPHLCRRGAVYYWQRRLPTHLAKHLRISYVKVNLRTKKVAIARRLVPPFNACAMEVFMWEAEQLSREQLGDIFKSVLTQHQAKLNLLTDLERASPTTMRSMLLDRGLAQGLAYKLLAEQGADAQFTLAAQQHALDGGQDIDFVLDVFEHLERLRENGGIKLSRRRLIGELEKVGATASPVNLTRAQPVYLQALAAAFAPSNCAEQAA